MVLGVGVGGKSDNVCREWLRVLIDKPPEIVIKKLHIRTYNNIMILFIVQ